MTASEASETEEGDRARSRNGAEGEGRLSELHRGTRDAVVVAELQVEGADVGARVNHELAEANVGGRVASAANATVDHMRDWVLGTPEGDWVSMGVAVDGQYGIDKGIICGLPCVTKNGQWSVVEGLELDAFSKPRIDASVAELREEYDAVKELGLI